jgi:hypothetical protein
MDWRRSAANTNKRGEKGSPCLTPLLQWKVLPGTPLRRTEEVPEPRMSLIQLTHLEPKPLLYKISIIAWCSSLSKAFSKSNLRMTISFLDDLHRWIYSNAHASQS